MEGHKTGGKGGLQAFDGEKSKRMGGNRFLVWGHFFVQILVFVYLLATLSLWAGWRITPLLFPLSVLSSLVGVRRQGLCWRDTGVLLLVVGVAVWLSTVVYDYSFDGQCYHMGTVMQLVGGWNPIYGPDVSVNPSLDLWINHYARGLETIAACIVSATGELESGKTVNFLFLSGTLFYVIYFLEHFLKGSKTGFRVWLALVIAFNPVVLCQLFTYYIDYAAYSLLLALGVLLYAYCHEDGRGKKQAFALICLLLFLAAGVKLNILFWVFLFMVVYSVAACWRLKRVPKHVSAFFLAGCLGVFIGAYHPYVTNWTDEGNPLYPLAGEGKVDIMTGNTPAVLQGHNRFGQVLLSLACNPQNDFNGVATVRALGISMDEIKTSAAADVRIGGFGIFFFESIVLLLFVLCFSWMERKRYVVALLAVLFLSLFLLPSGWWARYVSFFYAFPIVIIIGLQKWGRKGAFSQVLKYVGMLFLSADIAIAALAVSAYGVYYRLTVDSVVSTLASRKDVVYEMETYNLGFLHKLDDKTVRYKLLHQHYDDTLRVVQPFVLFNLGDYGLGYERKYGINWLVDERSAE